MKTTLKRTGLVLGAIVVVFVVIVLVGYVLGGARLRKTYDVPISSFEAPTDQASVERGLHWASVLCVECHGEDLGGEIVFEDPALGRVSGPNLTRGEGGASAEMSDSELEAAIRYGVDHDGRGLVIMPSAGYFYMSDEDLGALISYMRHAEPVDKEWEEPQFTFVGRVVIGLGLFGSVSAAEVIDPSRVRPDVVRAGATSEYGGYLARIGGCGDCHGEQLNGGESPNPASPPAPNLTPGGHLAEWSEEDFVSGMRTGVLPDGDEMEREFMPWEGIGKMTDAEVQALWLYLQSLPPLEDAVKEAE